MENKFTPDEYAIESKTQFKRVTIQMQGRMQELFESRRLAYEEVDRLKEQLAKAKLMLACAENVIEFYADHAFALKGELARKYFKEKEEK